MPPLLGTRNNVVRLNDLAEEMGNFLQSSVASFNKSAKRQLGVYPDDPQLRVDEVERLLALLDGSQEASDEQPGAKDWLKLLRDPEQFQRKLDLLGGPTERYLALS